MLLDNLKRAKRAFLKRSLKLYMKKRFGGSVTTLNAQEEFYRVQVREEFLRRNQLIEDSTSAEEVNAVAIVF